MYSENNKSDYQAMLHELLKAEDDKQLGVDLALYLMENRAKERARQELNADRVRHPAQNNDNSYRLLLERIGL